MAEQSGVGASDAGLHISDAGLLRRRPIVATEPLTRPRPRKSFVCFVQNTCLLALGPTRACRAYLHPSSAVPSPRQQGARRRDGVPIGPRDMPRVTCDEACYVCLFVLGILTRFVMLNHPRQVCGTAPPHARTKPGAPR